MWRRFILEDDLATWRINQYGVPKQQFVPKYWPNPIKISRERNITLIFAICRSLFFYEMHKMVVFQKRICLLSINVFVYVQSIIKDRKIFLTGWRGRMRIQIGWISRIKLEETWERQNSLSLMRNFLSGQC